MTVKICEFSSLQQYPLLPSLASDSAASTCFPVLFPLVLYSKAVTLSPSRTYSVSEGQSFLPWIISFMVRQKKKDRLCRESLSGKAYSSKTCANNVPNDVQNSCLVAEGWIVVLDKVHVFVVKAMSNRFYLRHVLGSDKMMLPEIRLWSGRYLASCLTVDQWKGLKGGAVSKSCRVCLIFLIWVLSNLPLTFKIRDPRPHRL